MQIAGGEGGGINFTLLMTRNCMSDDIFDLISENVSVLGNRVDFSSFLSF